MYRIIRAAYTVWTSFENNRAISRTEYEAAEIALLTLEPQSVADIGMILRMLVHSIGTGGRTDGLDHQRLVQMCDYLDAGPPRQTSGLHVECGR